ncbi:MAG: TlyA family RNA methyltransferase [Candidatus Auribacterota bacterium]|jgi:23S rRNA (cytidine1920-2'-O)/16S rRNA (cytidine1409-2'-O)-methyltransferase|nr:TlyA family RNA methyltransferase [Candidatus Auribacterota bacterium]
MKKQRIDQLLVTRGYYPTRERAKRAIMAGLVEADGFSILKPGMQIPEDTNFVVKEHDKFVSRGGYKIEEAINSFDLCVDKKVVLDLGASTGGFTDCLLQCGAKKVYAVDVGKGILDWSLRNDERVVVIEETNARYLKTEDIPELVDIVSADLSFISLKKVIPSVLPILKDKGWLLVLVKPQFEAGKGLVGKNGVVRDEKLISRIMEDMIDFLIQHGLQVNGQVRSPILGPKGNKEYMLWAVKQ